MANVNGPFGLKPVRHLSGGTIRMNEYSIADSAAITMCVGSLVEQTGTGRNIQPSAAGNADNIGVFAGCEYTDANGKRIQSRKWVTGTTGTNIKAFVYDDPNIVFEVQCDTLAAGDIGQLIDINVGTNDTTNGTAGLYGDVGAGTAGTDKTLRLLRLVNRPDNEYGAYAKAEVLIVEHALRGVVAGVGGV